MKPWIRILLGATLALLTAAAAHAAAQLSITGISAAYSGLPGDSSTFTVTISNISPTPNPASTANDFNGGTGDIAIRLTSTTADPIVLGSTSIAIPTIAAAANANVIVSFTIPLSFSQAGAYFANATLGYRPNSTATATATISAGVSEITMTNLGTGYTSAPAVTFVPALGGVAATAVIAGGAVIAIHVTNPGSGYASPPTVNIAGGGGLGAAASAHISGSVASIAMNTNGGGYSSAPTVVISGGGGGNFATATASLNSVGIGSVAITNGGSGYIAAPSVTFAPALGGAAATSAISGVVSNVVLVGPGNGGTGYVAPTVAFVGGGGVGAAATATVSGGVITAINVTAPGSGYTSAPTVQITPAAGDPAPTLTANATAVITASVSSITVTNPGSGYTPGNPPAVVFGSGNATAQAVLSGATGAIVVNGGGSGYTTTPTVTLSGGGSNGANTVVTSFTTPATVVTVASKPDLQITSLNYPAGVAYKGGDVIPMSLTYRNNTSSNGTTSVPFVPSGSGGATYFRIQVVLSSNPAYENPSATSDDFLLTFFDVPIIVNADSVQHTFSWNQLLPGNFPGSYYVLAKIDALNQVDETIENDLTQNGNNVWFDVNATRLALLPTTFPTMYLASTTGSATGNGYSDNPSITSDGRYVVFASDATNLIAAGTDTNNARDIFIYDNQNSTVRRINLSQQGNQANAGSANPAISANGAYVAFSSDATNLVLGDNNGFSDIFVVNTLTGAIALVSSSSTGLQANGSNFKPAISATGKFVAWESSATNLVATAVPAGVTQIYVRDRDVGNTGVFDTPGNVSTVLISRATGVAGAAGTGSSVQATISGGGRFIAFATDATNLGGVVTAGLRNIYLRDRDSTNSGTFDTVSPTTTIITASANGSSRAPSINQHATFGDDGQFIAFASDASSMTGFPGPDTNNVSDVFVYNRTGGAITRVSISTAGGQALDPNSAPFRLGSLNPSISATGRYVSFASTATNLTPGDGVGQAPTRVTAILTGANVTSLVITNPGHNYYSAGSIPNPDAIFYNTVPTVTFSGGGGSGASYTPILSGGTTGIITGFVQNATGAGYTSPPTVTINGSFNNALNTYVIDRDVSNSLTFDTAGNIATTMASVNKFGYQTIRVFNTPSTAAADIYPVISADGRWVAIPHDAETNVGLSTTSTNLLSVDANNARDVFLHDRRINALPNAAALPSVTITSPGNGNSFLVNTAISLTATATTTTGVVQSVQFFVNGTSVGTSTVFPYTTSWTPTAVGTFTLSALVTDSFSNLGVSSNVTVAINAAPSVGITSPVAGTLLPVGSPVTVSAVAAAATPGATITQVQFFANGAPIPTALGSIVAFPGPYSVSWTPAVSGTFGLTAVATDSVGVKTTSAIVTVAAGTPPVVSISSPAASFSVPINVPTTILAAATSSNSIASVQFFANGVSLGTDTTFPYSVSWTPTVVGSVSLVAIATDITGNSTTSAIVAGSVTGAATPTIAITSPTAAATVPINTPTTITVNAASPLGTPASVQYFAGATSIGTSTTPPFSLAWTPNAAGAVTLTAIVTDPIGVTATSAGVAVTVGTAATVSITAPATGTVIPINTSTTVLASATPAAGTSIVSVQFLANGVSFGTATTFPYSATFNATAAGTYSLTARATDSIGSVKTSAAVNVTVGVPAAGAPSVALVSPPNGQTVVANDPIVIAANASDPDGTVARVDFFVNNGATTQIVGTTTTAPYFTVWTPTAAATTYTISALVTDNDGNTTASATSTLTTAAAVGAIPTASLFFNNPAQDTPTASSPAVNPFAAVDVSFGSNLILTVLGARQGGTIATVQFFANGVSIPSVVGPPAYPNPDNSSPFYIVYPLSTIGPVVITALVTDDAGNKIFTVPLFINARASTSAANASVTLVSPTTSTILVGDSIVFQATHNFGTDVPPKIDFYLNGNQATTISAPPYQFIRSLTRSGTYDVHAVVRSGTVTTVSNRATLTVNSNTAPTVSITSPATGSTSTIGAPINITATANDSDGTIQSVEFFANGISIGSKNVFPYTITYNPGAAGTYVLTAIATDNSGNQTLTTGAGVVSIAVNTGAAPAVAIASPAAGASIAVGSTTTITASATAVAPATIASVQIFAGATLLGTATAAPYTATFTPAVVGAVNLKAVATDSLGNQTTSALVGVTVAANVLPTVSITSPLTGSSVATGSINTINATASDADGTVSGVQFFANGVSLGTDNSSPYSATWTPTIAGAYNLTAVATDNVGASATSAVVTVAVTGTNAPTVAITSPTTGSTVPVGLARNITASVNVTVGGLASLEFFANGVSLGFAPLATFPLGVASPWQPNATGNYSLTAVATDTFGNRATSAAIAVTVAAQGGAGAPTVTVTSPSNGATYYVGQQITLGATVGLGNGVIANVRFYANGVFIGSGYPTLTTPGQGAVPFFTVPFIPAASGSYSITAIATDTTGNQTTSTANGITVAAPAAPTVSIASPASGASLPVNVPQTVVANVTTPTASVLNVQFFANNVSLGTVTAFPYQVAWTPTTTGNYYVIAVVTNSVGTTVTSASNFFYTVSSGTPPTVSITAPVAAATVPVGQPTTVNATAAATAAGAVIANVEFFANGVSIASPVTTVPFSVQWTPIVPSVANGYTLTAVATDTFGNRQTSAGIAVTAAAVSPNLPTVTINPLTVVTPIQIGVSPAPVVPISASATDSDGTIAQVQFFANGVLLPGGTVTAFPYTINWTPIATGNYSLTAVAIDNGGNRGTSAPLVVAVVAAGAPTVSITAPVAPFSLPVSTSTTVTATAAAAPGNTLASVEFFANAVSLGFAPSLVVPQVTWTPAAAGAYVLTAVAKDTLANSATSAGVNVTVTAGLPPVVSITSPLAAANVTVGAALTITANATAPAGTIANVQFFVNGASIGTIAGVGPIFNIPYTPGAVGALSLTARATDNLGSQATSAAVNITAVAAPGPTVAITNPTGGSSSPVNIAQNVTANVTPAGAATITSVQFFANGVSLGTDATSPYGLSWTPISAGNYSLTATATDSNGTTGTSPAVNVTVTGGAAPVIAISNPIGGAILNVNTPQSITAAATSASGTVVKVQFFINGVSLATATTYPFTVPWTPATPGIYALTAAATDQLGNLTNSAVVAVTVSAGSAPTVSIASPVAGATIVSGGTQVLVANASAANGNIASVKFLANNFTLGTVTAFPYNFSWTPTAPGNYSLTAIATDQVGNQTISAPVNVVVGALSPGAPTVSITSPTAGASLPVGVAMNLAATASDSDGTIASVQFFANSVSIGTKSTYPYNLDFTPAATGLYVFTAQATDNGGNIATSTPVSVTVTGGTAPSVAITAPVAGAGLGVNTPQTITATASSSTGFINSVQFFINGVPLSTDTSFPYAAAWTPTAIGTYSLTARATDNLNNITDSAPITVVVGASAAPTVSVTNPSNGSAYTVGTALTLAATAADSDGTITQVQFFVNGVPQGAADTTSPYSAAFTANSVGTYTITAQATDNNGNVTTSTPVTVTIGANAAPTVAITSPGSGLSFGLGNQVLLAAAANDADGSVTTVQFVVNGLVVGTATSAPYNFSWKPTVAGSFSITAVATDNVGNVTTSAPIGITITSSGAPAVVFTNPVVGNSFGVGTPIPLAATPSGGNGPIAQVQFFVNGSPQGAADLTSPYSATWTPAAPGNYSLVAVATDSAGISSNSAPLAIIINGNAPPTVAISNPSSGTRVNGGTIINLAASAADADGTVASVSFLANGNLVGTATTSPYIVNWAPTGAGNYTVVAQAIDNSGNVTNSAAITVSVSSNRAPIVALAAPNNGAVVRTGSSTGLTANASDPDGTIASVQFFANGTALGSPVTAVSSQGGYRVTWSPTAEGIYRITAVALDNAGAATTSLTTTVLAVNPASGGADSVFTGTFQSINESGNFALISIRGTSAVFIGYSTTAGLNRTYFYASMPLDASGGFSVPDALGRNLITGSVNASGVSGTLDGSRLIFIGVDSSFFPASAPIASGYYSGNLTGRPASTIAAIVGYDGSVMLYAADGTFQTAGSGKVDASGNFNVAASNGGRFTGKAEPATGFLTGTLSGTNGGAFTGAISSGVSFSDGFLRNLSTRGQVGTGENMLFAGFVVGGTTPKQVLVRAVGPTLTTFGVTGALADPQLQIFAGNALVTSNDNWGGAPAIASAASQVGAFPLVATSRDSAIIASLAPGNYSATVSGVGGTTGIALVELYDVDNPTPFSAQKVMNVSTRGVVSPGQGALIAGFVVSGNTSKKLLIRGVGPTLSTFGVNGVLADPLLRIVRSDNVVVRENDNWEVGNDAMLIGDAATKVAAFKLTAGSKDAAILINLPPGTYTAQVSGNNNTSGIALIEVYEVP